MVASLGVGDAAVGCPFIFSGRIIIGYVLLSLQAVYGWVDRVIVLYYFIIR